MRTWKDRSWHPKRCHLPVQNWIHAPSSCFFIVEGVCGFRSEMEQTGSIWSTFDAFMNCKSLKISQGLRPWTPLTHSENCNSSIFKSCAGSFEPYGNHWLHPIHSRQSSRCTVIRGIDYKKAPLYKKAPPLLGTNFLRGGGLSYNQYPWCFSGHYNSNSNRSQWCLSSL